MATRRAIGLALVLASAACERREPSNDSGVTEKADPVKAYLSVKQCADRLALILEPEKYKDVLLEKLGPDPKACDVVGRGELERLEPGPCAGDRCITRAWFKGQSHDREYCVVAGTKIDWPCSAGHNDPDVVLFRATAKPGQRAQMRLWVALSDYYNWSFLRARATHYSFEMGNEEGTGKIQGYLRKDSPDADAVIKLIATGKAHRFCVDIEAPTPIESANVVGITSIKPGWWCR